MISLRVSQFICLPLLLTTLPACGDSLVYQWQENDKTYFSDQPHPNAKIIPIKSGYSYFTIKRVIDGDTIILDDATHIRLLGINTPEVGGRYKTTEAGGERAKVWLKQKLQGQRVRLETDVVQKDRYQRTLAHVFTDNGQHINLELVSNGLASVSIYPPNLKYSDTLVQAEQLAQQNHLGIWNDPAYSVKPVTAIDETFETGWQRLTGTPTTLHSSSRNDYINFTDNFSIRIPRANLSLFPDLKTYLNHPIEIRGRIDQQENGYSMLIRHPHAIKILSD